MTITVIGAGYVGLPTALVFAKLDHEVRVWVRSSKRRQELERGIVPFYEQGLDDLLKQGLGKGALRFPSDLLQALDGSTVVMLCVGTPPLEDGSPDCSQLYSAVAEIAPHLTSGAVVVTKSTVPVGTARTVLERLRELRESDDVRVASCPEFLREGTAVEDMLHPDRIVIGANDPQTRGALVKLHEGLPGERVVTTWETAELIKYAANAFLATKISFINEIANVCETVGADVEIVARAMGFDPRIGPAFLRAGIGYGGSCFPKDTRALSHMARVNNYTFTLLDAVITVNNNQRQRFLEQLAQRLGGLKGKHIGVLGIAFKAGTDDIRESAALEIITKLIKQGVEVQAHDPLAGEHARTAVEGLTVVTQAEDVAQGSDAVCILTEWPEFRDCDWGVMRQRMRRPLVLDGRNLLDPEAMRTMGFEYYGIGRPSGVSRDVYA